MRPKSVSSRGRFWLPPDSPVVRDIPGFRAVGEVERPLLNDQEGPLCVCSQLATRCVLPM